jgi:tetratricopeptide (TPR) repeat protein
MKTGQIGRAFILILVCLSTQCIAQSTIEDFVDEGVKCHENGDYDKAIQMYKKALELNPKSTLANYEIAFSYFAKGDYKKAIKHSDVVLDQEQEYMTLAYVIKGSSLDMLGKTKESIKLFEMAITKTGGHYLLYYNLGLNYYKMNDLENAEENAIKAIESNPTHSSSHLMLANIHHQKGNEVQTLLAIHYFLLLEPNTSRSADALQILLENFGGNVSQSKNKPNTMNILFSPNKDSQFGAAELMISLLAVGKSLEKNKGKTEDELFVDNTGSFFSVLGEMKKETNKDIWWTFYTTFFYELAKSNHLETYCKHITQSSNKNSQKWLTENQDKVDDFETWLQK